MWSRTRLCSSLSLLLLFGCDTSRNPLVTETKTEVSPVVTLASGRKYALGEKGGARMERRADGTVLIWAVTKGAKAGQLRVQALSIINPDSTVEFKFLSHGVWTHAKYDKNRNMVGLAYVPVAINAETENSSQVYCDVYWDENMQPIYYGPPEPVECEMPPPPALPQGYGVLSDPYWEGSDKTCCQNEWQDRKYAYGEVAFALAAEVIACWSPLVLSGYPCLAAIAYTAFKIAHFQTLDERWWQCVLSSLYVAECQCKIAGYRQSGCVALSKPRHQPYYAWDGRRRNLMKGRFA
jgi:hypothetical protein